MQITSCADAPVSAMGDTEELLSKQIHNLSCVLGLSWGLLPVGLRGILVRNPNTLDWCFSVLQSQPLTTNCVNSSPILRDDFKVHLLLVSMSSAEIFITMALGELAT